MNLGTRIYINWVSLGDFGDIDDVDDDDDDDGNSDANVDY